MTFRTKLMLTMAPLLLALAAVGIVSGLVARALARQPGHIWRDNYRSVLAAQRMKESVERLHEATFVEIVGLPTQSPALTDHRLAFEHELANQLANLTEPGEAEASARLQVAWTEYRRQLDRFTNQPTGEQQRLHYAELDQAFRGVKRAADEILGINQDAMVRKGQRTEQRATFFERTLVLAVIIASLLGMLASVSLTTRLLRPLGVVSAAVRRFGQGDPQARAQVKGEDDIAQLAQEFNTMADHLERYRRSSLGELLQAQQASQAAIDSLPDPVLMLDAAGGLQGINEATRRVLAIDPEERGNPSLDRVEPKVRSLLDRLRTHVVAGRGGYSPRGFEDAVRIGHGEQESIYLPRATPIYGEGGSVTGSAIVLQDITRLFRSDELKNNVVATVAHEFRTPLTSLRMAIHLCTEQAVGPLTEKQADLLFAARDDCERLQAIVDDLLNLSRLEAGRIELQKRRVEPGSLVELAVGVHRAAAGSRHIEIRSQVYPGLPEVFADPDRLQLVFANLLTNAIRYSPDGGEIVVRALPGPTPTTGQPGPVRFEISDQGPGISPEHQADLFQKFSRIPGTPSGGAGLGLFIARGVVQAHDGQIGVATGFGKGATFWFHIPAA